MTKDETRIDNLEKLIDRVTQILMPTLYNETTDEDAVRQLIALLEVDSPRYQAAFPLNGGNNDCARN